MQSTTIKNGENCCGLHGCTTVTVESVTESIGVSVSGVGGIAVKVDGKGGIRTSVGIVSGASSVAERVGGGINVGMCLMCLTSQGKWEYLFVEEGQVYELDGHKVMVKR